MPVMPVTAQDLLALAAVALAAFYLAYRGWLLLARKKRSACGGCSGCPTSTGTARPLVTLDPAPQQSPSPPDRR